jgi:hypothetical protein
MCVRPPYSNIAQLIVLRCWCRPRSHSRRADPFMCVMLRDLVTTDSVFHAGGANVGEAFEEAAIGMYGYMTELGSVTIDPACTVTIRAEGLPSGRRKRS